jgi:hypothetical protein
VVSPAARTRGGTLSFFKVGGAAFAVIGAVLLVLGAMSGDLTSSMGLAITGGTFAMIGVIWVLVAIGVGGWYGRVRQRQAAEERLFQTGQRATAVIEGVEGTGVTINDCPQVYLTLRVQPRSGAEFVHQRKIVLPFGSVVQPGYLIDVAYDPADPSKVALETEPSWAATPPAVYLRTRPPEMAATAAAAAPGLVAGASPAHDSPPTLIDQLERLKALKDGGALTGAEFEEQKRKLLGGG